MTSVPSSPDELEARLQGLLGSPRDAVTWDDTDEDAALVRVVAALKESASVPADVAAAHLARLLQPVAPVAPVIPLRRGRTAVRAGVAGVLLAGALGSGVGVAAASEALPGDALYGLKTARERLVVAMARSGDDRAAVHLRLARTRLDEAAELLERGDTDRGLATLARADAALSAAKAHGGDDLDAAADDELSHRIEVLTALLNGGLPETAADAAREAITRAVERAPGRPDDVGRPDDTRGGRPDDLPGGGQPGNGRPDDVGTGRPGNRGDHRNSPRGPSDATPRPLPSQASASQSAAEARP